MSAYAEPLSLSESLENTELTPTPSSDSGSEQRRSSDGGDKVNNQRDPTTLASELKLHDDIKTAMKVESSSEEHQPITTPMTPKRAASGYPTPPPTKKIRIAIKRVDKNESEAANVKDTDSKSKHHNKSLSFVVSERQDMCNKPSPVEDHEVLTPESLWEEERFDLLSPRLVRPLPLHYTSVEVKRPLTEDSYDRVSLPDTPADDIEKVLFLHPDRTDIRWVGEFSERKLARELEKYERVKDFWLFNYGHAYCPSWDYKHKFVAHEFAEEVQSPWVLAWLAELIGRGDVYLILDHLERRMRKELEGLMDIEDAEEVDA